jgi:tetratricopeptide (TPR) repeat protein
LSLDPVGTVTLTYASYIRYWERRYSESIAISKQLLERYPDQLATQIMMTMCYVDLGQYSSALELAGRMEKRIPQIRLLEVRALASSSRRAEALQLAHELEAQYESNPQVIRVWLAMAWASLGDVARTVKWLERSANQREFQVLNAGVNPAYAQVRNDPAFRALVKRIGL